MTLGLRDQFGDPNLGDIKRWWFPKLVGLCGLYPGKLWTVNGVFVAYVTWAKGKPVAFSRHWADIIPFHPSYICIVILHTVEQTWYWWLRIPTIPYYHIARLQSHSKPQMPEAYPIPSYFSNNVRPLRGGSWHLTTLEIPMEIPLVSSEFHLNGGALSHWGSPKSSSTRLIGHH